MKPMKYITIALMLILPISLSASSETDPMQTVKSDNKSLWAPASDAQQSTFSAISLSMIGWGVGLALGIIILSTTIKGSSSSE